MEGGKESSFKNYFCLNGLLVLRLPKLEVVKLYSYACTEFQILLTKKNAKLTFPQRKTLFFFSLSSAATTKAVPITTIFSFTVVQLSSQGPTHDEIDFEFLGNLSGDPYILHTNVFTQGKGNREQQFYLWFDPTKNFHTYSIIWKPQHIIFLVDNIPIRVFKNAESLGVPFPKNQAMRIYSSLWNADDWATRGGLVKTDWSKAPFTAYYRNFKATEFSSMSSISKSGAEFQTNELDAYGRRRLRWVQRYFMIYNYCNDLKRFPQGIPAECRR